ncbi:oligosaccharide flippase family protein [Pseudomonas borbori]|uniref:Membrane protein involved in the export of O-antigen and teichoic acid n=1 Tax=Pseudomonas borbori TaxID=289003 RepID=A0A1I5K4I9_9PSED|nr:oligosaccharide flippase family protein [Pseudomonas borbori]SFO79898.1 Membrane protein involved in the export of O-antigen and teichoic acid [Pseudomonas borbori]
MATESGRKLIKFIKKGFVRSVFILVSGSALSQVIMILVLPLLTRLYTPGDFSVLAVYVAALGIISIAACLRFDIAIPIPEHDTDAANLLAIALFSTSCIALFTCAVVWIGADEIVELLKQQGLRPYLWLLPAGVFFSGTYSALQYWTTRKKNFSVIAKTRMSQSIVGAGAQVGIGLLGHGPFGLLLGQMLSSGAGIISLSRIIINRDRSALQNITLSGMRKMFRAYDRFPKYSTLEAIFNSAAIQMPIIIIAALAAGAEAGFLMLALKVMQAPMGLVGGAVAQVYLSRAPEEYRNGTLGGFTADTLSGLVKVGIGPLLFLGIIAPDAFVVVFGDEWRRAGELVAWMTPWIALQFISSPVSMVMHVTERQRFMLYLTSAGFLLRVIGVIGGALYLPNYIVEIYAVTGALFYLACFVIFSNLSGVRVSDFNLMIRKSIFIVCGWVVVGYVVDYFSLITMVERL